MGELLAKYWADDSPVLILGCSENIYRLIKRTIKPLYSKLLYVNCKMRYFISRLGRRDYFIPDGPNILVKYNVGINANGRSDLFWLDSDICSHPNYIVYFDEPVDSVALNKDISYIDVCNVCLYNKDISYTDAYGIYVLIYILMNVIYARITRI